MDDPSQNPPSRNKRPLQFSIAGLLGLITGVAVLVGTLRALDVDVTALLVLLGVFSLAIFLGLAVIFLTSLSTREEEDGEDEL